MEEQIEKLNAETKEVQAALDTVNGILLEKGFKRGDIKEVSETPVPKEVVLPKQEPEATNSFVQRAAPLQTGNRKVLYR